MGRDAVFAIRRFADNSRYWRVFSSFLVKDLTRAGIVGTKWNGAMGVCDLPICTKKHEENCELKAPFVSSMLRVT